MAAVLILVVASVIALGGIGAIIAGCRREHAERRAPGLQLLDEVEEWLQKQP